MGKANCQLYLKKGARFDVGFHVHSTRPTNLVMFPLILWSFSVRYAPKKSRGRRGDPAPWVETAGEVYC